MGRLNNSNQLRRVTISIPTSLFDQLEKEVLSSGRKSISELIVSKIVSATRSRSVVLLSNKPAPTLSVGVSSMMIDEVGFTTRVKNCLNGANIRTVSRLARSTVEELYYIRNFGINSIRECQMKLRELGINVSWVD